jgi:hypothetical protein
LIVDKHTKRGTFVEPNLMGAHNSNHYEHPASVQMAICNKLLNSADGLKWLVIKQSGVGLMLFRNFLNQESCHICVRGALPPLPSSVANHPGQSSYELLLWALRTHTSSTWHYSHDWHQSWSARSQSSGMMCAWVNEKK